MILDQSLLQPLEHLDQATCESVKPTQSNKHEPHPPKYTTLTTRLKGSKIDELRIMRHTHPVLKIGISGIMHSVQILPRDSGFNQPPHRGRFVRQRVPVAIARDEAIGFVESDGFVISL